MSAEEWALAAPWRWMPNDLPPREIVYAQARRWRAAGIFEAIVHDLGVLLRLEAGRGPEPPAAILDSRPLRSTPESGQRAGHDGARRKRGSKVHAAVDTLGRLLALHVTPATAGDRAEVAFADQGYTGERPAEAAAAQGIRLEAVEHHEAKRGFVLLPHPWVVERSFARATRLRRRAACASPPGYARMRRGKSGRPTSCREPCGRTGRCSAPS